jgi:UDP-GlcNAc3NAcA epimerase
MPPQKHYSDHRRYDTELKTILSIIGARPQFIKHAPMQVQLQRHFRALTLHTGQHYDTNMSQIFFDELAIPLPNYQMEIGGAKHQGAQTAVMLTEIERVCLELKPDAILIYGDTNSTLAGALVASKMCIPLIHIEAGLRSYNRQMPEEVNRIVADTFSQLLFCPSKQAVDNLSKEGIDHSGVFLSGDVMFDTLEMVRPKIKPMLDNRYYFCTIHRPYNTDSAERMAAILDTLNRLPHLVIFSVHPRTLSRLASWSIELTNYPNIRAIEPVGYVESVSYQAYAECILTDSGGMQKEAYMLRKKCITIRSETEWPETLSAGWNTLVFDDIPSILSLIHETPGEHHTDMFGDGHAATAITEKILDHLH